MNRSAHALAGAAAWLALAPHVVDQPLRLTGAGCVLAVGLAAGQDFSPDLDQRWYAGQATGGHRHLTHWPETAAVLTWLLLTWLPPAFAWPMVVGWWSHLVGDFFFGGIPLLIAGGRRRLGFRFDTGGPVERWVALPLLSIGLVAAVARLTLPG